MGAGEREQGGEHNGLRTYGKSSKVLLVTEVYPIASMKLGCLSNVPRVEQRKVLECSNASWSTPTMQVDEIDVYRIGPLFEKHGAFPARTNTEFIEVTSHEP